MEPLVYLIIYSITGAIAAAIAHSKGRSAVGWFFIGFFFSLLGVIVAAIVSNKKEEERYRTHAQAERRRLREQLRQEKMKTESFRQHASARLDAHDGALGLDTRQTPALGAGKGRLRHPRMTGAARVPGREGPEAVRPVRPVSSGQPGQPGQPGQAGPAPRPDAGAEQAGDDMRPPVAPAADEVNWYYEADGESRGPIPQSTIVWMMESGALSAETLVWTEGQTAWVAAANIPAFRNVSKS